VSAAQRLVNDLRDQARQASGNAYAPYSGFRVGAVVVDSSGSRHAGCNVESDSYGLTQCAERNAVAAAIAAGVRKGEMVSVLVYVPGERVFPPCGGCRQVLVEMLAEHALIVSCCDNDEILEWTRERLLPDAFTMDG
jgi:cytidine deaminase